MNSTKTLRSYCTQCVAPVAMAITFALTGGAAFASTAGQNAIAAKLTPAFVPSLKSAVSVSVAASSDLLLALAFALEDPANVTLTADEIAAGALEVVASTGKSRADKDKIAGQIIATVAASRTLTTAQLGAVLNKVYSVSTGLKPAGKALAVAAALKSAGAAANGNDLGAALATVPGISAEVSLLLQNTSKALGTGTYAASGQLKNFVNGLSNSIASYGREATIKDAAEKVAAANATAAGAFYGGLVLNHPAGAYSDNASLKTLALGIIADTKLGKAIGEILGNTLAGHTGRQTLDADLITASTPVPVKSLIYQGILRAGTEADVAGVLDANALTGITDRATFAGVVSTGNGADSLKLSAIVKAIADGQDSAIKTKIGISVISAVAVNTPAAAGTATAALFDSAGASFSNDTLRLAFGTTVAPKIKGFAAVGSMAATIADRNTASTPSDLALLATSIMAKAPNAATDIAQQVSTLSTSKVGGFADFAALLANKNPKFVLNAAVGVSITSPADAGVITAKVITHNSGTDKAALGAAAKIAGAVALAVDEERAADIALELGDLMSDPKALTAGKPIKLSSAVSIATALAKALQAKQGVSTTNTMDELGESAANLIASILGKSVGKDAAAKAKAEAQLVSAVGSAFLKALSPKPTLNGEYGTDANLRLYASKATLKADQTEAQDIVGSIAQTILSYYTAQNSQATGTALIAPGSALEKAFLKLSGKKGSADLAAATTALNDVRNGLNNPAARFEDGTKAKINSSVNDKETDSRNL